ncbi:hypothetical protein ACB092_09G037000 [Castanea dentata]
MRCFFPCLFNIQYDGLLPCELMNGFSCGYLHSAFTFCTEQRFSRQCLSSPETMEANGSSSNSNESQPSGGSNNSSTEKPNEKEIFVNHAEIAWHEKRREWVGDQSQRTRRMPREPIMSWTTTYEDLLLSTEPFQQPIPLAEMVDFLVDIWNEEGLYD